MNFKLHSLFALSLSALSLPLFAQQASTIETREPEAATGVVQKHLVAGDKYMVAAANPYASQAGRAI